MNKIQKRRFIYVSLFIGGLALAAGLILYALKQNINVFLTPSQLSTTMDTHYRFRLGGLVKKNSVAHAKEGLDVSFVITDLKREVPVHYTGVLPDLFREGTGVIAEGYLTQQGFMAQQVLAKHDENYIPKNVYSVIKKGA